MMSQRNIMRDKSGRVNEDSLVFMRAPRLDTRDHVLDFGMELIATEQTLFHHRAKDQPANPPKSIDCNSNCHNLSFSKLF